MIDVARRIDVWRRANIDWRRVEMGCRLAMLLIIVKTLVCTRAIKGFYYDEKLCKLSEKLVDPAKTLEPGRIALEPRLEPDAGGREAFRAQHENTARPAAEVSVILCSRRF